VVTLWESSSLLLLVVLLLPLVLSGRVGTWDLSLVVAAAVAAAAAGAVVGDEAEALVATEDSWSW